MENSKKYLDVAVAAAKKVSPIFLKHFGNAYKVQKKQNDFRNLVTAADKEIEKIITKKIQLAFPEHKILGEEFGWETGRKNSDYIWIIDPIDGTTNFIQGLPLCCISIALWDGNGPVIGVVYNPVLKLMFTSERGKGAYLNGEKIRVSKTAKLKDAIGTFGWRDPKEGIKLFSPLVTASRKLRVMATSVLTTSWVGQGVFDYYAVNKIFIWDFAAGAAILLEAGGEITDFEGKPFTLNSKSAVISNGKIHKELLNKLKGRK